MICEAYQEDERGLFRITGAARERGTFLITFLLSFSSLPLKTRLTYTVKQTIIQFTFNFLGNILIFFIIVL